MVDMFSAGSQFILCLFFIVIADDCLSLSHSCSKLLDTTSIQVQPTGTAYSIQPAGTAYSIQPNVLILVQFQQIEILYTELLLTSSEPTRQ